MSTNLKNLHVAATGHNPPWAIYDEGSNIVSEHPSKADAEAALNNLNNLTTPDEQPTKETIINPAPKKRRGRPRKSNN